MDTLPFFHRRVVAFRARALACVTDLLGGEFLELGARQKHDEDVLAHDHASSRLVGKLGIKVEAETSEELHRPIEISDRKIHENLGVHGFSF
jgi:hypothetical protein